MSEQQATYHERECVSCKDYYFLEPVGKILACSHYGSQRVALLDEGIVDGPPAKYRYCVQWGDDPDAPIGLSIEYMGDNLREAAVAYERAVNKLRQTEVDHLHD